MSVNAQILSDIEQLPIHEYAFCKLAMFTEASGLSAQKKLLIVTLEKSGEIMIGKASVEELSKLGPVIRQVLKSEPEREVLLEADDKLAYGRVGQVMAAVKGAGGEKLGMVTRLPVD